MNAFGTNSTAALCAFALSQPANRGVPLSAACSAADKGTGWLNNKAVFSVCVVMWAVSDGVENPLHRSGVVKSNA